MYNCILPVGNPVYYEGKYEYDKYHPLYIQELVCSFELKEGMLPTLLEKQAFRHEKEYVTSSHGDVETLVLTSVDLELFFEHYEVDPVDLKFTRGYKFQAKPHLFDKYIEKWSERKIQSKKDGNAGMYQISKIMLNALYGKFGSNPNMSSKSPYLSENDIVKYHTEEAEIRDSIYIPMASFITAYARKKTIETSQKIKDYTLEKYGKDYYVYSDTDSIHAKSIPKEELEKIIEVDDYKLGAWKLESLPKFGKYIRQKTYMDYIDGIYEVTCAGLSKQGIKYNDDKSKIFYKVFGIDHWIEFNIDDFKQGFMCGGKLSYKYVPGGCVLVETEFELKEKF